MSLVVQLSIVLGALVSLSLTPRPAAAAEAADTATAETDTSGLAEITVTAEKFNSTVQSTPISMTALTGDQLAASGITSMEDIIRDIPGLSMRSAGPGFTEIEARGLASNGGAAPTVGFYLDEVPLSPPALSQSGKIVIDPDLYDLNRVEVLRGPQGTLYGSGSMGGTVKLVTNQPKLDTFEGSFQGSVSDTEGGSGNGGGSVMLNLPLGDILALRVVATDTYRSGWLDRVVVSPFPADNPGPPGLPPYRANVLAAPVTSVTTNVNTESLYGGRATVLFQPSADFSVVAMAFYQRLVLGGYDDFDSPPGASYMAHYEAFNIPEPVADTVHIYSLTATANLGGFADLTSSTAYWQRLQHQTQDASESASLSNGVYPYVNLAYSEVDPSQQFSQELRVSSRDEGRLHWTGGAYYSDLHSLWNEYGANTFFAAPGNPTGIIYTSNNPYRIDQYALFADGSFKILDTLKFSTGVRWYRYQSSQYEQEWGYDASTPVPVAATRTTAAESGYNPRFNLSYTPTPELTAYISASKGFRPGGANQIVPPPSVPPHCAPGAQTSFGPDSVWNYEIGEKAKFFDNWLSVNSDFYYIRWTDIQQTVLQLCGYEYESNAGNGRSFGPEIEVDAKLSPEWFVSASGTYTDARLTQPNATYLSTFLLTSALNSNGTHYCVTASGCTAPIMNVPKQTANLSLIYKTKVFNDYDLTARVADSYVGPQFDEAYFFGFQLPSYSIASARVGLSTDKWSANLFVDNLTNKVAELTGNNTSFQFNIPGLVRYTTNQPRTFGTQINYKF